MTRATSREGRHALLLSLPAGIGLLVFLILPFAMAIALTFTNQKLLSLNDTEVVGFRNYERLLAVSVMRQDTIGDESAAPVFRRVRDVTRDEPEWDGYRPLTQTVIGSHRYVLLARDPVFIRSLFNTLLFALLVVPLQCSVALGLALLVNSGVKGQSAFRTIYFSPVVMSMVVVAVIWTFLFNRDFGLINEFLSAISGGVIQPVDWLGSPATAMPAIVIMSAWQGAGLQMLIFLAGLQAIPTELYDAARIDGANGWQRFVNITLPGLVNTIAFVVVVTTISAFGLFTQVDVMTQGGPAGATSTVMFYAIERGVREQDIAYGSTITVVYFCIIAVIAVFQQRWFGKKGGT